MSRYVVTIPARQDITKINRYFIGYIYTAARRLREKIKQRCKLLADFPQMGQQRDELEPGLRSVPVENYLIFYRPIPNGVEILRVVSGYRDLEEVFSSEDID